MSVQQHPHAPGRAGGLPSTRKTRRAPKCRPSDAPAPARANSDATVHLPPRARWSCDRLLLRGYVFVPGASGGSKRSPRSVAEIGLGRRDAARGCLRPHPPAAPSRFVPASCERASGSPPRSPRRSPRRSARSGPARASRSGTSQASTGCPTRSRCRTRCPARPHSAGGSAGWRAPRCRRPSRSRTRACGHPRSIARVAGNARATPAGPGACGCS